MEKVSWDGDWQSTALCDKEILPLLCPQTGSGGQQYVSWSWFGVEGSSPKIMAMDASLCNLLPGFPGQGSVFPSWSSPAYIRKINYTLFKGKRNVFSYDTITNLLFLSFVCRHSQRCIWCSQTACVHQFWAETCLFQRHLDIRREHQTIAAIPDED